MLFDSCYRRGSISIPTTLPSARHGCKWNHNSEIRLMDARHVHTAFMSVSNWYKRRSLKSPLPDDVDPQRWRCGRGRSCVEIQTIVYTNSGSDPDLWLVDENLQRDRSRLVTLICVRIKELNFCNLTIMYSFWLTHTRVVFWLSAVDYRWY